MHIYDQSENATDNKRNFFNNRYCEKEKVEIVENLIAAIFEFHLYDISQEVVDLRNSIFEVCHREF